MEKIKTKNKLLTLSAFGGIGLVALTGCSSNIENNKPATVLEHIDNPAYTSLLPVGKTMIPQYHPETFELRVRQCDRSGDEDADKQGCVTADVDVNQDTYDQYQDGDTIIFH